MIDWSGEWNCSQHIRLGASGGVLRVTSVSIGGGFYANFEDRELGSSIVTGIVSTDGKTVTGTWRNPSTRQSGTFQFVASEDGGSFSGKYSVGTESRGENRWNGKRTV